VSRGGGLGTADRVAQFIQFLQTAMKRVLLLGAQTGGGSGLGR